MTPQRAIRKVTRANLGKALMWTTVFWSTSFCSVHVLGQLVPNHASPIPPTPITGSIASGNNPHAGRRADITYSAGLLTVEANNSSLNQILRDISRRTGMKITGHVAEDHVFGTYGPAAPAVILATLLDGTGSNLLLLQNAADAPTELVLTPRTGTATPPNPNAPGFDTDNEASDEAPPGRTPTIAQPPSSASSNSRAPGRAGTGGIDVNPAATAPSSTSQQLAFPPVDASTPPSTATTTPTTPDASSETVKTPQQIFEQLQRLRQQQPTQQTAPQ